LFHYTAAVFAWRWRAILSLLNTLSLVLMAVLHLLHPGLQIVLLLLKLLVASIAHSPRWAMRPPSTMGCQKAATIAPPNGGRLFAHSLTFRKVASQAEDMRTV
jgi:hypothetical protein